MTARRTMWGWQDTVQQRPCRAVGCGRPVWFVQNVKTGNVMPFARPPAPLASTAELETGRVQILLDLAHVHWADCAARTTFRRRR